MNTRRSTQVLLTIIAVSSRFAVVVLPCAYVTAILTGHLPYDSVQGTMMLVLAAAFWVVGDIVTRALVQTLEYEEKKEP